jgi:hypothetical protein
MNQAVSTALLECDPITSKIALIDRPRDSSGLV